MQGIYRKAVRWIYPRYEGSAWFRLAVILGTAALFNAFFGVMVYAFGDGPIVGAVTVLALFAYSWAVTCVLVPGAWFHEDQGY